MNFTEDRKADGAARPSLPSAREACFPRRISREVLGQMTEREREVGILLVRGLRSKEIADHLGTSVKKVEKHRESLFRLLRVHSAAEAVQALVALGVTTLGFVATD